MLFWYMNSRYLLKSGILLLVVAFLFSESMHSKNTLLFCEVSQILTLKMHFHIQNDHAPLI